MADPKTKTRTESFLETAGRYLNELTSSGDYSTETKARDNTVKKEGIQTYKGNPEGKGAAEGVVTALEKRKKMLDDL